MVLVKDGCGVKVLPPAARQALIIRSSSLQSLLDRHGYLMNGVAQHALCYDRKLMFNLFLPKVAYNIDHHFDTVC